MNSAEYAEQRKAFRAWMRQVDAHLASMCGLTSNDLADQCYFDWFEDGLPPREAAEMALEDEGFDLDWLE